MLKIKFIRYKNVVVADILEQGPEILRGNYRRETLGQYTYKVELCSAHFPALAGRTLFLRGVATSRDEETLVWKYNTEEEAKAAVEAFQALIEGHNYIQKIKEEHHETQ